MTRQFSRPASLLVAARQNMTKDLTDLDAAGKKRVFPAYKVVQECAKIEGRTPTVEEALAAIRAAMTPSEEERVAALRLAASLRMAGVASREVARAFGVSESQLSRMLSAYPEAGIARASDVVFDDATGRWTLHSAATVVG
ncbi:helix-turn-helix domain-containing protein [Corynebacterium sp. P3-F1]|uniref:helix-turn-helix domain-containing protein n=1 Tax=Corynebacterium sp. P3-F1 TaxID=3059080 RepID=UPI00265D4E7A|nr:helix-turn-helix domain-containing protein [Corynebacterium sp. P3-F1]WKK61202.1 helix-turn-helix domain-containing protein [Corynebacterium sp. P3-F1]